ncbi:uncharacterized protein [Polyergus mexicanus]|uniref:uncharacterized protein n=1 Tax=Polyergus mexicanus TaxID=615972 RepID=UPI0038B4C7A8
MKPTKLRQTRSTTSLPDHRAAGLSATTTATMPAGAATGGAAMAVSTTAGARTATATATTTTTATSPFQRGQFLSEKEHNKRKTRNRGLHKNGARIALQFNYQDEDYARAGAKRSLRVARHSPTRHRASPRAVRVSRARFRRPRVNRPASRARHRR